MRWLHLHHAEQIGLWRRRAEQLRALARATAEESRRAELSALAEQWESLATQTEANLRRKLKPDASRPR